MNPPLAEAGSGEVLARKLFPSPDEQRLDEAAEQVAAIIDVEYPVLGPSAEERGERRRAAIFLTACTMHDKAQ